MGGAAELDLMALVLRRWRAVAVCAVLGLAVATTYALLATEWFEARLSVVPSGPSREGAAMAIAANLAGINAVSTDSKLIEAVLVSRSVADAAIEKFKLVERYEAEHMEEVRKALGKRCTTTLDKKSSVVELVCEDTDPVIARDLTAYFGEVGNQVFGRIAMSSASAEAQFLAGQVAGARKDVDDASRTLRDFQELHKVIDLPEQAKAVISAMASMQGLLISKQLELAYLRGFAGRGESSVLQLHQQIAVLQTKLDQLEAAQPPTAPATPAPATPASAESFFPSAMSVPGLRFELEQLIRHQKIKETVFTLLTQRHEMAKVDAAHDTPSFQVLDRPTLPTRRSYPERRKIAVAGGLAGVLFGMVWVVLPVWWRRRFTGVAAL